MTRSVGSRVVGYLRSAEMEPDGNVSVQEPNGFRVVVPPSTNNNNNNENGNNAAGFLAEGEECRLSEDYTGQYTPLLRGRIIFGPQPMRFFFSTFLLLFLLCLLSVQASDITRECGVGIVALGYLLNLVTLISYFTICLNDPGVIPENYRLRELIWDTESYRDRNPDARFYRYCQTCRGYRPPRSKHCSTCDICIRDHETHLFVGGTCVGQRTARSLYTLSLVVGLYTIYLIVVNVFILKNAQETAISSKVYAIVSLVFAGLLLVTPQLGIILFLFRLYLVGQGYTGSSYITRNMDSIACPLDKRSSVKHYLAFFFGKKAPSIFRKKTGQVEPESGQTEEERAAEDWESLMSIIPAHGMPLIQELVRLRDEAQQSFWREQRDRRISNFLNSDIQNNNIDNARRDQITEVVTPRPNSTPSDPQLYNGELNAIPNQRLRKGLKSRICDTLHQRMENCQKGIKHVSALGQATLSEGSIPRVEETRHLVTTARAQQFRRLIHLVLSRDRRGLEEMGRTVNIPALLGVQMVNFDPDNLQFVELGNGLPMLSPRRETGQAANLQQNRMGGLLGIPQMVAAGLLPPARQLAQDMENVMGGPGSIRRIPSQNTNRFVYQALRHPYSRSRQAENDGSRPHGGVRIPLGFPLLDSNPRFIALLNDHQQFRRETFERLRGSPSWGFPSLGLTGQRRSRERHRSHHRPRGVEHSSSPTPPPPSGGLNVVSDTANNNHSDNNNTPLHDNAS